MTVADLQALPRRPPDFTLAYGEGPSQTGELRVPDGPGPFPVVVLIHGGCWKAEYATLQDLSPMGDVLKEDGIASWNIEYRRLSEPGSGWPGTYADVGHAIDHLRTIAEEHHLSLDRLVILGHSAGGHLAMWAGTRANTPRTSPLFVANPLPVRGVINLAGTIDMTQNISHIEAECGGPVVTNLLGGTPDAVPERYAEVSANTSLPSSVRQVLIWGEHEEFVPRPLAEQYVSVATQAGDLTRLIVIPGVGHFELGSPSSSAWPQVEEAIRSLLTN